MDDVNNPKHEWLLAYRLAGRSIVKMNPDEPIPPIPDPEGRFAGLTHGGVDTITTFGGNVMFDGAISYRLVSGEISTVKDGFVFDWASVPAIFTWYLPPSGDGRNCYGIAALFHDWLYCHRKVAGRAVSRAECDALFLEIMLYVGVDRRKAILMYRAARLGGWLLWWKRAEKDIIP